MTGPECAGPMPFGDEPPPVSAWEAAGWEETALSRPDADAGTAAAPLDSGSIDVARVARDVAAVIETVNQHTDLITTLAGKVEELLAEPAASKPSPFSWAHAAGEKREELWTDVAAWVDQYNARFGTAPTLRIEQCWYLHPVVVEELTALMEAWLVAYVGHQLPTVDAIHWLQNYLYPSIGRIRNEPWGTVKCGGGHVPPRAAPVPAGRSVAEELQRAIDADVAQRPDPVPGG